MVYLPSGLLHSSENEPEPCPTTSRFCFHFTRWWAKEARHKRLHIIYDLFYIKLTTRQNKLELGRVVVLAESEGRGAPGASGMSGLHFMV